MPSNRKGRPGWWPVRMKQVPGRKTDVSDAAWLCQLLEAGLLRPGTLLMRRAPRSYGA
jgi:hypothetical protein